MSDDLRTLHNERANGDLQQLIPLRRVLGLAVCDLRRVEGQWAAPGSGVGAGALGGDGDEVAALDAGLDLIQLRREVGLRYLLHLAPPPPAVAAPERGRHLGREAKRSSDRSGVDGGRVRLCLVRVKCSNSFGRLV